MNRITSADWRGRVLTIDAATGASSVLADGLGSALIAVAYHDGHVYAGTNDGVIWDVVAGRQPRKVAGGDAIVLSNSTGTTSRLWEISGLTS